MEIAGLIIDPQSDFCDPSGALYVGGAEQDMKWLSTFLTGISDDINRLYVTMDAHHLVDIAHPVWWKGKDGQPPRPFTIITLDDVESGVWQAAHPDHQARSVQYVRALAMHTRYPLCIWPPHCLIGHPGQNIVASLSPVLDKWEARTGQAVFYVMKGQNPFTEHYSAIRADVPDPSDVSTDTNHALVDNLYEADRIWVAGEAGSHCVANTVRDLVAAWSQRGHTDAAQKLVLLTDTMSPVSGFEHYQDAFLMDMRGLGVQTATTTTFREKFLQ